MDGETARYEYAVTPKRCCLGSERSPIFIGAVSE